MKNTILHAVKLLLIAALLGMPLAVTTTPAYAQGGLPGGGKDKDKDKDDGPNAIEKMKSHVESVKSKIEAGPLDEAYKALMSTAKTAEELNVEGNNTVRGWLRDLSKTLVKRADAKLDQYVSDYEQGDHDKALAGYKELVAMEGLPTAKKAAELIATETDRIAWRETADKVTAEIEKADYIQARESIIELKRLARPADYKKQTDELIKGLNQTLKQRVDKAVKDVENKQFDDAYAALIEISRITDAREAAGAARSALREYQALEGMHQAKDEYDARQALAGINAWYSEIASPSKREQQKYQETLDAFIARFPGTRATKEAEELLAEAKKQEADA